MVFCFRRYGDPALAAEPGFHDQTPGGVDGMAVPIGHSFDKLPELFEHFTEYLLAGCSVQADTPGGVVIDLAGREVAQAAQPAVIELMGYELDLGGDRGVQSLPLAKVQSPVQVPHAPLD